MVTLAATAGCSAVGGAIACAGPRAAGEREQDMGGRVVLHIGTMKSGTTYLQSVLMRNLRDLPAVGVDYTGGFAAQREAVQGVRREGPGHRTDLWHSLARAACESRSETSVISMEFLAFSTREQARRLLRPFEGTEVRVLITVRDQLKVVPAAWQSYVRNRGSSSWPRYLEQVDPARSGRKASGAYRRFHRAHDVAQIVRHWRLPAVSGIDVVTVPPSTAPREELLNRFAQALGFDPTGLALDGLQENVSLGYGACDWLARANTLLVPEVSKARYKELLPPVARRVLASLEDQGRPALDVAGAEFARERNRRYRAVLDSSAVTLVGSLEDLPVPEDLGGFPEVPPPPQKEEVLLSARAAHDFVARWVGAVPDPSATGVRQVTREVVRLLGQVDGPPPPGLR